MRLRDQVALADTGTLIDGKYRLDAAIGEGGFGVVYRARHVGLGRTVAIKLLRVDDPSGKFFVRFRREAEALGRLTHPRIVSVTDFGVDPRGPGVPYLVMELVEGETLEDLTARGPLAPAASLALLDAIAEGIDAAHAAGVLHGDLKAANIIVGSKGAASVKVIDFGLARIIGETPDGRVPGEQTRGLPDVTSLTCTPEYCAPELTRGIAPTRSSDIYAFGVLAYRMFTGRFPYAGTAEQVLRSHTSATPVPPSSIRSDLPAEVDVALARALAKIPADRPPTASALVHALRIACARAARREWRQREGPRRLAMAAALATLATAGSVWLARTEAIAGMENAALDLRQHLSPVRPPDRRLLVVTVDDEWLNRDPTPLAESGDRIGAGLTRMFDLGAAAVAIDMLLPEQWGRTQAFSRLLLQHSSRLVLAAAWTDGGEVVGVEALDPLVGTALGPDRAAGLFGLVNSSAEADGVVRWAHVSYADVRQVRRPTLAGRIAALAGRADDDAGAPVLIDARVDWAALERWSWLDLERRLATGTSLDDRIVVLGADYVGSGDLHRVVGLDGEVETVPGVLLQARMADALANPRSITAAGGWPVWAGLAVLILAGVALTLVAPSRWFAAGTVLLGTAAWLVAAAAAWRAGYAIPVAPAIAAMAGAVASALAIRGSLGPVPR